MNIYAKPGDFVVFAGEGGYNADRDKAGLAGLVRGEVYAVEFVDVGNWYSYVRLEGVPGEHNTVMFEDFETAGEQPEQPTCCADQTLALVNAIDLPGEPIEREYFIEATVQLVVKAYDGYGAALEVKERIAELIRSGYAPNDPMHGSVIDVVQEVPDVR